VVCFVVDFPGTDILLSFTCHCNFRITQSSLSKRRSIISCQMKAASKHDDLVIHYKVRHISKAKYSRAGFCVILVCISSSSSSNREVRVGGNHQLFLDVPSVPSSLSVRSSIFVDTQTSQCTAVCISAPTASPQQHTWQS
jgi:hypothetical protein